MWRDAEGMVFHSASFALPVFPKKVDVLAG